MNARFKQIRAKQLLKDCTHKAEEREKYVNNLLNSNWESLDAEAWQLRLRAVSVAEGYAAAMREVIGEIEKWGY